MVMSTKVLVVEDEVPKLFAEALGILRETYEVIIATRGDDAVRLVREQSPDVILMDLRLPGMDGIEAIHEIRKFDPEVPIFAVTAYSDMFKRQQVMEAGATLYLLKPVEIGILIGKIDQAIKSLNEKS